MASLVKVKMIKGKLINGGVWLPGLEPYVSAEDAKKLVDAGEAEYVKPEKPAAKDAETKES